MRYPSMWFSFPNTLFFVAPITLSSELNSTRLRCTRYRCTGYGCKLYNETIIHLFNMGDLKLFARNQEGYKGCWHLLKSFAMTPGWILTLINVQKQLVYEVTQANNIHRLRHRTTMKYLDPRESNTFLELNEVGNIKHAAMTEQIRN